MHSARAILDAVDLVQRAEMVLQNAEQLNCRVFVRPEDIVSGSQRLNLAFLANLFHGYPALEKPPEVEEQVAEIEETREEKSECFSLCCIRPSIWIQSKHRRRRHLNHDASLTPLPLPSRYHDKTDHVLD
ncbi:unnamed protein product [Trichobilharzia regenti]|nr:unnamed protein product [Trichobilharzia regenti]